MAAVGAAREAGQAGGRTDTVGGLLAHQVRQRPDHPAVEDGPRGPIFSAFNAGGNRLAHVLRGLGIERGDRVAILSENRVEYLALLFSAGGIAGYKRPKEIRCIAADAFPRSNTGNIQRHEVEKWLTGAC